MRTTLLSLCLIVSLGSYAQQKNSFRSHFGKHSSKQGARAKSQTDHLPQTTAHFNWQSGGWELMDTMRTFYNAKGLADSALTSIVNGQDMQTNYTYDSEGRLLSYTTLARVDAQSPWDSSSKAFMTYDQHGYQTSEINYVLGGMGWEIQYGSKTAYTYNSSNLLATEEVEYYDKAVSAYVKDSKGIYEYNSTGVLSSFISMTWDEGFGDYQIDSKVSDVVWYKWIPADIESSLLASANVYEWDGTAYQLSSRMSTSYDSHDNETGSKSETLDSSTWLLDYADQYLLTYNRAGALTERIEQSWRDMDSAFVNEARYVYGNFLLYNGLKNTTRQEIGLTISPNPFNEKAEITIAASLTSPELALYDLTGKKLQSHHFVSGKCEIEKGDLASGLYFYTVTANQQTVASGKVVIK